MKKRILAICLIVLLVVSFYLILSANLSYIVAAKQQAAFTTENNALEAAMNDLLQTTPQKITHECNTYNQSYWRNEAYCHTYAAYGYQATAQPGGRESAIKRGKALETILKQRGWTNDRPQDDNQTIEATLPTEDMFPFHGNSIPMHKNIGPVSCNLSVEAGGSVADPIIMINQFSCSQHITYYFPHFTRHYRFLV